MARKTYISIAELARRYGYTFNAAKAWRAEGLPYSDNPAGVPEEEGTIWVVQNKINPLRNMSVRDEMEKEKLREQTAKADLASIAVKEKSGELISVDFVQHELNEFVGRMKTTIRLIPNKHALEILESATDIQTLKETLKQVIDKTLIEVGEMFDEEIEETESDSEKESDKESESEIEIDLN
ncbi:hypothetical protein [Escherichia coli]|uniref:hypothetical protein n=1 Tax=Escherichia coli TaxID=562 RepID=UPI002B2E6AD0|nr:hypothetical protein VEE23_32710 [Escherichia coli]HCO0725237.1 hypothetical protein [Escherichia coli]